LQFVYQKVNCLVLYTLLLKHLTVPYMACKFLWFIWRS
jgi:hypothetical protein